MEFQGRARLLGEYQLGKTIGQGAFSKVKLGYHRETGQKVAIKIVDKKLMAEKAKQSKEAHEERERRLRAKEQKQNDQRQGTKLDRRDRNNSSIDSNCVVTKENSVIDSGTKSMQEENSMDEHIMSDPSNSQVPSAIIPAAPDFVSKLQLEVQLMLRLDHPNIVKVYQVIDTDDECFIVMEFAKGGELIEYIASRDHLSEKEARRFFRQIISAIDHCHLANVVHRDLKLENLLLNGERNILLSDFGLGRTFRDDFEEYMKTFCGTPNYAAVELVSGIPYVGVKSDIWAMGVVLYLMVTGKPPFYGDTISMLYKEIKAVNYKVYDNFSKELRHLLSRMLCKNPSERIDMDELRKHPWVNLDEAHPPERYQPRVRGNIDNSVLNQLISGVHYEKDCTIYIFRRHQKEESRRIFPSWVKDGSKSKPDTNPKNSHDSQKEIKKVETKKAEQSHDPQLVEESKNGNEEESAHDIPELTKKNAFQLPAFLRRISFSSDKTVRPNRRATIAGPASISVTINAEDNPSKTNTVSIEEEINPPEKTVKQGLSIPIISRRHSNIGPSLSVPDESHKHVRRASGSGIPMSLGHSESTSDSKSSTKPNSLGFQLIPALSAIMKRSSNTINTQTSGTCDTENNASARFSETTRGATSSPARPSFHRSSTFNGTNASPLLHLDSSHGSELKNYLSASPGLTPPLSPLPPTASSIRTIRRASHAATLEKRASFGASREVVAALSSPQPPRANQNGLKPSNLGPSPWVRDEGTNRLGVPGKHTEISKSHHAFGGDSSLSPNKFLDANHRTLSSHAGHSEIAKSAILAGLGQAVDDDEKLGTSFGSHDMMSITSRWTDKDESAIGSGSGHGSNGDEMELGEKNVQAWHELNRPAKMIRSMRFSFNNATSSSMDPESIYKRLIRVLQTLAKQYQGYFAFQRQNPDYYVLTCRLLQNSSETDSNSLFEIEVCKVWLLNLHGIRIKRIAGSPIVFKEIYSFIESQLDLASS